MPPVYVIHCPEFEDRTFQCFAHLRHHGVNAIPWRSIHGKSWGLRTELEYEPGLHISPGHIGLILGHWTLWNHLTHELDLLRDHAIIFEDDVEIPADFWSQYTKALKTLRQYNPEWEFCYLGLAEKEPQVWGKVTERVGGPASPLCRIDHPFGTHAYMIKTQALYPMLEAMKYAQRNIDQQLYRNVWEPKLVNWCAILPSIVRQKTYDYDGKGRPEWDASTLDEKDLPYGPSPLSASYPAWKQLQEIKKYQTKPIEFTDAYGPHTHNVVTDAPARAPEGYEQTKEAQEASIELTDPYPCIYRGEFIDQTGYEVGTARRTPLNQCALLNTPCHSKSPAWKEVVTSRNPDGTRTAVTACHFCPHRLGVKYRTKTERLPLPDGHFNPSLAWYNGRLILSTRDNWGHSKVALWELANTKPRHEGEWLVNPIGSFSSDNPDAPRLEDTRLFIRHDPQQFGHPSLASMFNLPDGYPPKLVRVGHAEFSSDLKSISEMEIFESPQGNAYEKNWVPFECGDQTYWIYATKPEHIVLGKDNSYRTPNRLPWTGGVIRGGAAPVICRHFVTGEKVFYHFFHGCLKGPRGNVYTVGCLTFKAEPPFNVLSQTVTPLMWPDLPALGESVVKRYVVWPGGAVLVDDDEHLGKVAAPYWLLALGIDDTFCRIVKLDCRAVDIQLKSVPESGAGVVSIRDTDIAHGVKIKK